MNIPFVDLKTQYNNHKKEIDFAIHQVINDCAFVGNTGNKYVKLFESAYSDFMNVNYCIGCGNGTDALEIALKALNIGPGDEVIVPSLSWIATSECVSTIGATPVFVDIEADYYTINPELIEEKITAATKAIIPVHIYGQPANMKKIMSIAKKHRLKVIEDCAQAHGAEIDGAKVGTIGDLGTFSFFPGKNLGAYGDAGGIITNDKALADKCRMISQHGQSGEKHKHLIEGRNSRMDGIQAAILLVKLQYLSEWTNKRIELAKLYSQLLRSKIKTPSTRQACKHVFHLYVIESTKRNEISEQLRSEKIACAIQYPTPLPFLDAYKNRGFKPSDFPVALNVCSKILSLPIYPELTQQHIEYITSLIE